MDRKREAKDSEKDKLELLWEKHTVLSSTPSGLPQVTSLLFSASLLPPGPLAKVCSQPWRAG